MDALSKILRNGRGGGRRSNGWGVRADSEGKEKSREGGRTAYLQRNIGEANVGRERAITRKIQLREREKDSGGEIETGMQREKKGSGNTWGERERKRIRHSTHIH